MIKLDTYLCEKCQGIYYVKEGIEMKDCPSCSQKWIIKPLPPNTVSCLASEDLEAKIDPI